MTFRALLVLLGCAFAAAHATAGTYQRFEAFDTPPKNWRYFNPNQGFGFFPTSASTGLAGGFFFPKTYTSYYADTSLNGAFHRGTAISASGTIELSDLSFDPNYTNTVYIAHFRKGSTKDMFVNIVGLSLTGTNQGTVNCAPIVQFSNGDAFLGKAVSLHIMSASKHWSYTWEPTGGTQQLGLLTIKIGGHISTLTMGVASSGLDYSIDSFGLYQPAFAQPNSNSFFTFFIGNPGYTAFVGPGPSLHVKGPKNITTAVSPVPLAGTSHIAIGNRVTAVRYRIVHNGKTGHYKNASGLENWSASVPVPSGSSHIEVTAFGDNGLKKTVRRNVTRTP